MSYKQLMPILFSCYYANKKVMLFGCFYRNDLEPGRFSAYELIKRVNERQVLIVIHQAIKEDQDMSKGCISKNVAFLVAGICSL